MSGGTTSGPVPIGMAFDGPQAQRRWTVLIRLLLLVPQVIVVELLGIAAAVVAVIGWFGALLTGQLPAFAYDFLCGYLDWAIRVAAYGLLLTDRYPPFRMGPADYAVRLAVPPRQRLNRAAVLFRFILVIPAGIVSALILYGSVTIFLLVAWLVTLVTGRLPDAFYGAYAAVLRYYARYNGYVTMLTPTYPVRGLLGEEVVADPWRPPAGGSWSPPGGTGSPAGGGDWGAGGPTGGGDWGAGGSAGGGDWGAGGPTGGGGWSTGGSAGGGDWGTDRPTGGGDWGADRPTGGGDWGAGGPTGGGDWGTGGPAAGAAPDWAAAGEAAGAGGASPATSPVAAAGGPPDQPVPDVFTYGGATFLWGYTADRQVCGIWRRDRPDLPPQWWPIGDQVAGWERFRTLEPAAVEHRGPDPAQLGFATVGAGGAATAGAAGAATAGGDAGQAWFGGPAEAVGSSPAGQGPAAGDPSSPWPTASGAPASSLPSYASYASYAPSGAVAATPASPWPATPDGPLVLPTAAKVLVVLFIVLGAISYVGLRAAISSTGALNNARNRSSLELLQQDYSSLGSITRTYGRSTSSCNGQADPLSCFTSADRQESKAFGAFASAVQPLTVYGSRATTDLDHLVQVSQRAESDFAAVGAATTPQQYDATVGSSNLQSVLNQFDADYNALQRALGGT